MPSKQQAIRILQDAAKQHDDVGKHFVSHGHDAEPAWVVHTSTEPENRYGLVIYIDPAILVDWQTKECLQPNVAIPKRERTEKRLGEFFSVVIHGGVMAGSVRLGSSFSGAKYPAKFMDAFNAVIEESLRENWISADSRLPIVTIHKGFYEVQAQFAVYRFSVLKGNWDHA